MKANILIIKGLSIPLSALKFQFSRSGGHGGQNVNKVETRVELLFDVEDSTSFTEQQRELIQENLSSRIDENGILHIVAQKSRYQWHNRQHAIRRFIELLQKALRPKKKRIKTKISEESIEKRLDEKKHRSEIKKMRRIERDH
jgi:ribosome-associated protein